MFEGVSGGVSSKLKKNCHPIFKTLKIFVKGIFLYDSFFHDELCRTPAVPFISGRALAFKDLSNFFQHMIFAIISKRESKVVKKFVKSKDFQRKTAGRGVFRPPQFGMSYFIRLIE